MDINGNDHYDDAASDSGNDSINGAGVIENQVDSEDSASASDVSSSITQLDSDDFERYFTERNDRLFHSHGNSPYPLPVDTLEQERLNALHDILAAVLRSHFVGPVQEILARTPGDRKRVLDICTGTGRWPMEMASEFSWATFNGFDIVPIATRHPLRNVHFEIHNVNQNFRWTDNTMDLVHARYVAMAVIDYPSMLTEAARVLRPGGLFISGEWDRLPSLADPTLDTAGIIPNITRLMDRVDEIINVSYQTVPSAAQIPRWVADSGLFRDITHEFHEVPIGNWQTDDRQKALGINFREQAVRYGDSLGQVLKNAGYEQEVIDELVNGYLEEINDVSGLKWVYHTVHAIKA